MPNGKSESRKKYRCSDKKMQEMLERIFTVDDHGTRHYDAELSLPHRSAQPQDYVGSLEALFDHYQKKLSAANDVVRRGATGDTPTVGSNNISEKPGPASNINKKKSASTNLVPKKPVEKLCAGLLDVLAEYHRGLPAGAFNKFDRLMTELNRTHRMPRTSLKDSPQADRLFRMRRMDEGLVYPRKEIFHPSTDCRHLIGTNRYSIPGYPTLYLTDSLTLAQRESGGAASAIAACFHLNENFQLGIIEFGIRPRDFELGVEGPCPRADPSVQISQEAAQNYLVWFPLLAACSFVRAHPDCPYADEYVLPQLLMQWIRTQSSGPVANDDTTPSPGEGGNRPLTNGPGPTGPVAGSGEDDFPLHQKEGIPSLMTAFNPTINKLLDLYGQLSDNLANELRSAPELLQTFAHMSYLLDVLVRNVVRFVQTEHLDPKQIARELEECRAPEQKEAIEALRNQVNEQLKKYTSFRGAMAHDRKDNDSPSYSYDHLIAVQEIRGLLKDSSAALYHARRNLNWLLNLPTRIIGIRYFSCRNDVTPTLGTNFAFPMEPVSKDGEPESSSLNEYFSWTNPVSTADFPTLDECEKYLTELARDKQNLGNCDDGS